MSAAQHVVFPCFERRFQFALFLCRARPRKIRRSVFGKHLLDQTEILFGKHFRRREIRRLKTAFQRHKNTRKRHRRLSASDVALQKAIHSDGRLYIVINRTHGFLLTRRKRIGKAFFEFRHFFFRDRITSATRLFSVAFDKFKRRNERKILLYGDPLGGRLHFFLRFWRMNGKISLI